LFFWAKLHFGAALLELVADIRFDRVLPCLVEGWCEPEAQFSWTIGKRSLIDLPCAPGAAPYSLIIQGHPYLHRPELCRQRLDVEVNGKMLAALEVDDLFTHLIRIPQGVISQGRAQIVFHHPDSDSPARHGATDTRSLGIRFWHIRLFRVSTKRDRGTTTGRRQHDRAAVAQQLGALTRQVELTQGEINLCKNLRSNDTEKMAGAALDLAFRKLFLECLSHGYIIAASEMARRAAGTAALALEYDGSAGTDISIVRFTKSPSGACVFGVSPALRGMAAVPADMSAPTVIWRFLAILPMFARYARSAAPAGTCLVNLGDEGHARGVAFCNVPSMDTLLVPDPYFLSTQGYADMREPGAAARPWDQRRPVALWRGAPTGYRTTDSILDLPRLALCALAARNDYAAYLDAGVTGLAQVRSQAEIDLLQRMGMVRDFIPPARFQNWKYHIDIDGNTNSWPGLFQKLLSGSVVLKVASARKFAQWYYDRLKPFEHFVPVQPDMSDLIEKIRILRANDQLARAIGAQGRARALSISVDAEIRAAQNIIETAVSIETHTADLPVLP
jgi:hypothetical protein